jgi:hypothetical protein
VVPQAGDSIARHSVASAAQGAANSSALARIGPQVEPTATSDVFVRRKTP